MWAGMSHRLVKPRLEVAADVGAGVLVERQRGRGVADEHVQQPDAQLAQLRQRAQHLPGDQMKAARSGVQRDLT